MSKKYLTYIVIFLLLITFVFINFKKNVQYKHSYKFTPLAKMNIARAYHQSILLDDDNILIVGGTNNTDEINEKYGVKTGLKSTEIYNFKSNKFTLANETNLPHVYHNLFKMDNGNIVVADFNGIEIFDVKTKKFKLLKTKPSSNTPQFNSYKFVLLPNDRLLVLGGGSFVQYNKEPKMLNKGEIIDLNRDKLVKTFDIMGSGFGTLQLSNNNIIIAGGYSSRYNYLTDIYLFDAKNLKYSKFSQLKNGIVNPFMFLYGNNVLILGGKIIKNSKIAPQTDVEILNLNTKQTKTLDISKHLIGGFIDPPYRIVNAFQLDNGKIFILKTNDLNVSPFILNIEKIDNNKITKEPIFYKKEALYKASILKKSDKIFINGGQVRGDVHYDVSYYDEAIIEEQKIEKTSLIMKK